MDYLLDEIELSVIRRLTPRIDHLWIHQDVIHAGHFHLYHFPCSFPTDHDGMAARVTLPPMRIDLLPVPKAALPSPSSSSLPRLNISSLNSGNTLEQLRVGYASLATIMNVTLSSAAARLLLDPLRELVVDVLDTVEGILRETIWNLAEGILGSHDAVAVRSLPDDPCRNSWQDSASIPSAGLDWK